MLVQLSLLLLPVAAAFGWAMGRRESPRTEVDQQTNQFHPNYFKGLNYLINEQPDKAVDVFVQLLEVDSDTVEMHLALGNLFRRRGEVDRAIRIHQNLIARPQLDREHRVQAMSALAHDYLFAGVLDRAERLFLEIVELGGNEESSLRFLLYIYQQEKEWQKAIRTARKLEILTKTPMRSSIAQYYCELSQRFYDKGQVDNARAMLKQARSYQPECVRASILAGDLERELGQYARALRCYQRVMDQDPHYLIEVVKPLEICYQKLNRLDDYLVYLRASLKRNLNIDVIVIVSQQLQIQQGERAAAEFLLTQLDQKPSLRALEHLAELYMIDARGETRDKLNLLQRAIRALLKDKPTYRCTQCGYTGNTLFWLCPSCHAWSTVKPIQQVEYTA